VSGASPATPAPTTPAPATPSPATPASATSASATPGSGSPSPADSASDGGTEPVTLADLVARARRRLDAPLSDRRPEWIVGSVAGVPDGALGAALGRRVDAETEAHVDALVARCAAGEPVQYVVGVWPFRDLDLTVDARVLIPRPETEGLVELALREVSPSLGPGGRKVVDGEDSEVPVCDLGTGSGAVALSLAFEGPPTLRLWAGDDSDAALEVARRNLDRLAATTPDAAARVRLVSGSWFDALPTTLAGRIRLVVSNPPYVAASEWEGLEPEVRDHEPRHALVPGPSGREALELLVDGAAYWLAPVGALVLELAPDQAEPLAQRARSAGSFDEVVVAPDLTGRARYLVARRDRG